MESRKSKQIMTSEKQEDTHYIAQNELNNVSELNDMGNFGVIYKVTWQNKPAVQKQIAKKGHWSKDDWKERCDRERDLMRECNHPNIVGFYGYSIDEDATLYSI